MTKPWVVMVAGTAGLFVVGMAVRHFSSSRPPEAALTQNRVAAVAAATGAQRTGWTARTDSVGPAGANGNGASGAVGRQGTSGWGAGGNAAREGAATTYTGGRAYGRRFGTGVGGNRYASANPIHIESNVPQGSLPFDNAARLHHDGQQSRETRQVLGPPPDSGQNSAPSDPNSPVFQASFDNTTQPEKGPAPEVDKGVTFDSGQGAVFSTDSRLAIPNSGNINPESGTISFQIQPDWNGTDPNNASMLQLRTDNVWQNRLQVFKNGPYLRFLITPDSGVESGVGVPITNWQAGDWHNVTVTWGQDPNTGANVASMYIDGRFAGSQNYDGSLQIPPGTPLYVGSDYSGGLTSLDGAMSNVQIYNTALSGSQVAANYGTVSGR